MDVPLGFKQIKLLSVLGLEKEVVVFECTRCAVFSAKAKGTAVATVFLRGEFPTKRGTKSNQCPHLVGFLSGKLDIVGYA